MQKFLLFFCILVLHIYKNCCILTLVETRQGLRFTALSYNHTKAQESLPFIISNIHVSAKCRTLNFQEEYIMKEKVVLAYSGGLDTTALIPWLKETFDYEVVCCCVNCGQGNELDGLDERAKLSGASKLYIEDIVDDFSDNYIMPCVQAGAVYEHKYLLGTSMARPAIAKKLR